MQRILPVSGGINSYLVSADVLVSGASRECPYCEESHRLRLHGHYHRFALLPGRREAVRVAIRRLLCVRSGRTVSLLPDFCIPRRQHGPEILGEFLVGYAEGKTLLVALRAVRPEAPSHAVAQSLRDGFLARAGPIRTYLAGRRARALLPPASGCVVRRQVSALLIGLRLGFASAAESFMHHGVELHRRYQVSLA